jgi:hypothetical protein
MMRRLPGLGLFLLAGFLCSPLLLAQDAPGISNGRNRFSITGTVRDGDSNEAAQDTLVELRQFNGPTIAQVYTGQNGGFAFSNLQMDTYDLVVDRTGYDHLDQQVTTTSNMNIALELHRTGPGYAPPGGVVVSARELSIPHKAHDAMEKGLALLYQKMDYPGSLEQFQRAVKEYPDYYEAYARRPSRWRARLCNWTATHGRRAFNWPARCMGWINWTKRRRTRARRRSYSPTMRRRIWCWPTFTAKCATTGSWWKI